MEAESAPAGTSCSEGERKGCFLCLAVLLAIGVFTYAMVSVFALPSRNIYAAIDSVSGLDFLPPSSPTSPSPPPPPTGDDGLAALTIDPAFNLTVRVSSGSHGRRACLDARTYAEVSYRCVPLAASPVLPAGLCAGARKSADWRVAARGVGVRLLDGLAEDARAGVEAFDVTLKRTGGDEEPGILAICGVRRVGDAVEECDINSYRFKNCLRSTKPPL